MFGLALIDIYGGALNLFFCSHYVIALVLLFITSQVIVFKVVSFLDSNT